MRVFVTGSSGFIGRHLCKHLTNHGFEVMEFDKKEGKDILKPEPMWEALKHCKPSAVVHLAGNASVGWSKRNVGEDLLLNVLGTINMLKASMQCEVKRFVFASSAQVYGRNCVLPVSESSLGNPETPYGISKLTAEQYCKWFSKQFGLKVTVLRLFNVYGSGQRLGFVIPDFIAMAKQKRLIEIKGNCEDVRDFVHVSDVVEAIRLALSSDKEFVIYNVCTGKPTTIKNLAHQISCLFDNVPIDAENTKTKPFMLYGSFEKIRRELEWTPRVNLTKGLKEVCFNEN